MKKPITRNDHDEYIAYAVGEGVRADNAKEKNERKENQIGDLQNLDPQTDQGDVQDEKQKISQIHTRYDAPENVGASLMSMGPGWTP